MASILRGLALALVIGLSLVVLSTSGCNNDKPEKPQVDNHADHEAHPMPKNFVEAVAEIKEHAAEVKAAFDAGNPEEAHEALHFLGDLSEKMTALIDASDLTDEKKTQAKEASEVLFDQYMDLDGTLHDDKSELKYSDVSTKIDESLKVLVELRNAKTEPAPKADATDENPEEETSAEEKL